MDMDMNMDLDLDLDLKNINNGIDVAELIKNCLANNVIFTVWTGANQLNENRVNGIKQLREKSQCTVINVNVHNINDFIKPQYPLHPAYQYLSLVHRADYLRCYLMHHYGGGYSDIKPTTGSWISAFNKMLKCDPLIDPSIDPLIDPSIDPLIDPLINLWIIGYNVDGIAYPDESTQIEKDMLDQSFNNMVGVGFFICKPYTPFTSDWYTLLHKRLDFYLDKLRECPAQFPRESADGSPCPWWEGGALNDNGYPIGWNRILGQIVYPLQLRYLQHIQKGIPGWAGEYR